MRYASPIYENDIVEATDVIAASGDVTIDTITKDIVNSNGEVVAKDVPTTLVTVDFGGLCRN